MSGEGEAAGDVLTGSVLAATIESSRSQSAQANAATTCRNCGTIFAGAYCSACGQAAHLHRSLLSLGHEILHGVFHFEGKTWHTVPLLFFRPGQLTRRYIDGERAKFVSPMALFLFTVFLMFAVFAFTGGALVGDRQIDTEAISTARENWQSAPIEATNEQIAALRKQLEDETLPAERRAAIQEEIQGREAAIKVMQALGTGDLKRLSELDAELDEEPASETRTSSLRRQQQRLAATIDQFERNPDLLLYKMKTNGYKFSWALIPLSLPFVWLLFFWRRDVRVYDHAIFTTYSLSFMMLLLIVLSIGAAVGLPAGIWVPIMLVAPPLHMYKQLRGTYGLSRFGALVRLFFLLIAITIVVALFSVILLLIGVLG